MEDHTYSVTELVGTSSDGVSEAVENGMARAQKTLRNLDWFEVTNIRGRIEAGRVAQYQVTMKVGFRIED